MTAIGKALLSAVENGDLEEINQLFSNGLNTDDICYLNLQGQSILDLAIDKQYFLIVDAIIKLLQQKDKELLKALLLTIPSQKGRELPILKAAKLKNREIFDLLIKQTAGYSFAELEEVKRAREQILAKERRWGKFGAFLESACPSKSLADLVNAPLLIGGGFITSVILLFALTIVFALIALVGLVIMSYANYQNIIAERNIESESLSVLIQSAQLSNLKIKISDLMKKNLNLMTLSEEEREEFREQVKSQRTRKRVA